MDIATQHATPATHKASCKAPGERPLIDLLATLPPAPSAGGGVIGEGRRKTNKNKNV